MRPRHEAATTRSSDNVSTGPGRVVGWLWCVGIASVTTNCASGGSEIGRSGTGLTSVAVGALSSSQATVDVQNEAAVTETTVAASLTTVWRLMPAVLEQLQVEVNYVDPGAGTIGNGGFRARRIEGRSLSTYLDCGAGLTGPYADAYEVRMSLLVQLGPAAAGGTVVRTAVDAYAEDRAVASRPIHCQSRGVLERRINALVEERLAA